jgi:hypothetical protein
MQLAKPNISQVKRNPHRQLPARFLGSFRQYCPCSDFTMSERCQKVNKSISPQFFEKIFILHPVRDPGGTFIATMSERT